MTFTENQVKQNGPVKEETNIQGSEACLAETEQRKIPGPWFGRPNRTKINLDMLQNATKSTEMVPFNLISTPGKTRYKKSLIRETLNLSNDADNRNDKII